MVKISAVVDSACLIGLERIGRLDLLPALIDPVFAPPAVNQEFGALPIWMNVQKPVDVGMVLCSEVIGHSQSHLIACEAESRYARGNDERGRAKSSSSQIAIK